MTHNSVSIQTHLGALLVRQVVDDLLALAATHTTPNPARGSWQPLASSESQEPRAADSPLLGSARRPPRKGANRSVTSHHVEARGTALPFATRLPGGRGGPAARPRAAGERPPNVPNGGSVTASPLSRRRPDAPGTTASPSGSWGGPSLSNAAGDRSGWPRGAETPRRGQTLGAPVGARASHGPGLREGDPASGPRGARDGAGPPRGAGARAQAPRTAPAAASLPRPGAAQPGPRAPGDRHIGLSAAQLPPPAAPRSVPRPHVTRRPARTRRRGPRAAGRGYRRK